MGASNIKPEHVSVFDMAFGNRYGVGSISLEGHIRMLGATQPFITGAISKTCNVPGYATVRDIYDGYLLGRGLKLKALTVFRDNSKPVSPLNFGERGFLKLERGEKEPSPVIADAITHRFEMSGVSARLIVSEYDDGRPCEVYIESFKGGSEFGELFKTMGVMASKSLTRGVDLGDVVDAWLNVEMPSFRGLVRGDPDIKTALSPQDYIAKFLLLHYMGRTELTNEPDKVDVRRLQGFKNGAFRTYHRRSVDEWDVDQVLADPELGGFEPKRGLLALIANKNTRTLGNERGKVCDVCGSRMEQYNVNCYRCTKSSCGNMEGGCGI